MNGPGLRFALSLALLSALGPAVAAAQEPSPAGPESFYASSLHFTNRGLAYVSAREQGGVERITGRSAEDEGCLPARCHVTSCDTCHKKVVGGKASFTTERAVLDAACDVCHPVEKDDPDIHFSRGMKCLDCHTAREIHGDGVAYDTYQQPGVLEVRCERCHAARKASVSHTVHGGRLGCPACHTLEMTTCLNCHYETRRAKGKDAQIPLKGMLFLVNHDGQVTTANLLTYVAGKKTMITLAASFAHSVRRTGLDCPACHDSALVRAVAADTLVSARWQDGAVKGVEGVIPAVEGMTWRFPFLDRRDGAWVPLEGAEPPVVNFAPYTTPLSRDQFAKLARGRGGASPR